MGVPPTLRVIQNCLETMIGFLCVLNMVDKTNCGHVESFKGSFYSKNKGNLSKHWMQFVEASLHNFTNEIILDQVPLCLRFQQEEVAKLIRRGNKKQTEQGFTQDFTMDIMGRIYLQVQSFFSPCKVWYLNSQLQFYQSCWFYEHRYSFKLFWKLTLNITVDQLFLSSGNFDCKESKLMIWTPDTETWYCGHHSRFFIFPPDWRCDIVLVHMQRVLFLLDSSFFVIDSFHTLSHHFVEGNPFSSYLVVFSYLFWEVDGEIICTINVNIAERIMIERSFLAQMFHVFDGPGFLSPLVQEKNRTLSCSSFICVVIWKTQKQTMKNQRIKYISIENVVHTKILVDSSYLLSMNSRHLSDNNVIIVRFSASEGLRLNASLIDLTYVGASVVLHDHVLSGPVCTNAGLVIGHSIKFDNQEQRLCTNFSLAIGYSRSFYSTGSSMNVLLFSFPKYGSISVLVNISVTACRLLEANLCETYLLKDNWKILAEVGECLVVQFFEKYFNFSQYYKKTSENKKQWTCTLGLIPQLNISQYFEMQLEIMGVLQSAFYATAAEDTTFDPTLNERTEVINTHRLQSITLCGDYNSTFSCTNGGSGSPERNSFFYTHAVYGKPMGDFTAFVEVALTPHTQSWVDIVVALDPITKSVEALNWTSKYYFTENHTFLQHFCFPEVATGIPVSGEMLVLE